MTMLAAHNFAKIIKTGTREEKKYYYRKNIYNKTVQNLHTL